MANADGPAGWHLIQYGKIQEFNMRTVLGSLMFKG